MGLTLRKIDLGRLTIIPAFTFLLTLNSIAAYKDLIDLNPNNLIKAVGLLHHLLIVCFYILLILLYFLRTSAISSSKSPVVNTIAIVTTFLPFSIPLIGKNSVGDPLEVSISSLIIIAGMLLSIFALSALGRNISIIPQARKLVKNGPYRLIRHPLYVGEVVGVLGIVVGEITMLTISVFLLFMVAQIYRSLREEKLLGNIFPDYQEYCLRTPRFIPGLF